MKVVFTEAVLTPEATEALRIWWQDTVGPLLENHYMHHMTIAFRPTHDEFVATPVGDEVALRVVGYVDHDGVQAVAVEPVGVSSSNAVPHVTVATAGGVKPFASNKALEAGYKEADGPLLPATVAFFDGRNHIAF